MLKMFKRFVLMAKPWWKNMIITVIALIVAALLNMLTPELISQMTGLMTTEGALTYETVILFFVLLTASYVARGFMKFLSLWQAHIAAWSFVADTTLKVFGKLEELPMSFYSDHTTGEIMSKTINDTRELETLIAHALPDLFSGIIIVIFVTVRIFLINPILAAIALIPIPFTMLVSTQFSKRVMPLFKHNRKVLAKLNSHIQDRVSGIKEIKAFGKEGEEYKTMQGFAKEYAKVNIRANFANGIYQPSVECIISMGTAIVMGLGGTLALKNTLSTSDIVGFFMYLSMFYTPLSTLGRIVEDIQSSAAGGSRVLELLDTEVDIKDAENAKTLQGVQGEVTFENVEFAYPGGDKVLDGVSFVAHPGEMLAIVGATGEGKTTIISLLERFYEPQGGSIRLDNEDIKCVTTKSLRSNLSIVLQDVFLFNGSIKDNIAYGATDATDAEIMAAAKMACADDFILAMPNGYETQIGERGTKLSGGQKQRIAIARAILRKAPVLILDEATSAVDNETESEIQTAIENIMGKSTIIVIAHRLSTVQKADKILVLKHGKICESGSHQELLAEGGLYAKMIAVNTAQINN